MACNTKYLEEIAGPWCSRTNAFAIAAASVALSATLFAGAVAAPAYASEVESGASHAVAET